MTASPSKNYVTSKSPVGDIPVVTLIRTDTTLDHSQKAEKVCGINADAYEPHTGKPHMCWLCGGQARSEHALCPWALANRICIVSVGTRRFRKNWRSHIDASHSRQPLVKGERLVRYEVNAMIKVRAQDLGNTKKQIMKLTSLHKRLLQWP